MAKQLRYSEFVDDIDIDVFEEAMGFEVLDRRRDNDIGRCPDIWGLHKNGDRSGKFGIHREKKVYNCWVCGGGSLLSLVMDLYGYDIDEATAWLHVCTKPQDQNDNDFLSEIDGLLRDESLRQDHVLPHFNENTLLQFESDHPWFEERCIPPEIVISYRLGFDEDRLRRSPRKDGVAKFEDYRGPAIILPHFWGGRLMGWQERWLQRERPEWVPKYTMTPDFPKSETLFNYDRVLSRKHPVVVVEGVPSVLRLEGLGIPTVATFGSSVSEEQLRLLRRFQRGVILAPDNDTAGTKSMALMRAYLEDFIPVRCVDYEVFPEATNVADLREDAWVVEAIRMAPSEH